MAYRPICTEIVFSNSKNIGPNFGDGLIFYRPQTKLREGNVFTNVCHSVGGGSGVGISHAPWDRSHGRYPFTPIPPPHPPNIRLGNLPLLLTFGGHHWRPVQTCSLEDLPPTLVLTSSGCHRNGRYASFWNAVLCYV